MRYVLILIAILCLAACSTGDNQQPPCEPAGTYEVTLTRLDGDCPDLTLNDTITVYEDGDTWTIVCDENTFDQLQLDAATCDMSGAVTVSPHMDNTTATNEFALTFSGNELDGLVELTLSGGMTCHSTYEVVGVRQ